MRAFTVLRPPVVVDPMPLPPIEVRLIRVALTARPAVRLMQPLLREPTIIRRLVRAVSALWLRLPRKRTRLLLRPQRVLAATGARPPPAGVLV